MRRSLNNEEFVFYENKNDLIGTGAFSRVYRGVKCSDGRAVAIKTIDCANLTKRGKSKLDEEIRLCKELDHRYIVKTYDIVMDDEQDYIYIVLELCDYDMSEYMTRKKRPLSERETRKYMKQLMIAFQYLRSKNIIHRDLKPQNILIKDRTVKIADFGMARSLCESEMTTTVCGSPLYMAPEVLNHLEYSEKADLWSLGMIMYEMLYGTHPYHNVRTPHQLITKINQSGSIRLGNNNRKVSKCAKSLLRSLLQKDVDMRMTWMDLFTHEWFVDRVKPEVVPPPINNNNTLTFSQEVDREQYGEYQIDLGNSCCGGDAVEYEEETAVITTTTTKSKPISIHNPEQAIPHWRAHVIDNDYYQHFSEPIMTYTVINDSNDDNNNETTLSKTLFSYMTTSVDLLRSSVKYFNSL